MINSTVTTAYHNGDGSTTQFSYPFRILNSSDLRVYLGTTLQTTGYSLSGVGVATGGTVTFNSAPDVGVSNVVFQRATSAVQTSQYPEGNKFPSSDVEANFDQRAMIEQETNEMLTRSFRLHVSNFEPSDDFRIVGNAATRALRTVRFTENGRGLELGPSSTEIELAANYAEIALNASETAVTAAEQSETAAMVITAKGDLLVGQSFANFDNLAVGSNGKILTANSSATLGIAWESPAAVNPFIPQGYIHGLSVGNNGTDATNDIDIGVGECASTNANSNSRVLLSIASGLTKRLDATWSAGNNNGMRSSSLSISNSTWHIFAIRVSGSDDIGADTDINAANLIADHGATAYRRIFSIVRSEGGIIPFLHRQVGRSLVVWKLPILTAQSLFTAGSLITLSVPTGLVLEAVVRIASAGGLTRAYHISDPSGTVAAASVFGVPGAIAAGSTDGGDSLWISAEARVTTDDSGRIRATANSTSGVGVYTVGYYDHRGTAL